MEISSIVIELILNRRYLRFRGRLERGDRVLHLELYLHHYEVLYREVLLEVIDRASRSFLAPELHRPFRAGTVDDRFLPGERPRLYRLSGRRANDDKPMH